MSAQKKQRKGFTLTELLIVVTIIGILAALVAPKIMKKLSAGPTDIVNTITALKTAEQQWYDDQGKYAFAPRCFQDPSWASFADICGDSAKFKGQYLNINVANWLECSLDPTASATDKNGCFARQGYTIEITNAKGADTTYGTHGAIVVQDVPEVDALRIAGILSGQGEHAYDGQTYSSASIPKDETAGKPAGFWIEEDTTSGKYDIYVVF